MYKVAAGRSLFVFLFLLAAPDEPGRSARCLLVFADVRLSLSQKFKSLSVRWGGFKLRLCSVQLCIDEMS